MKDYFYFSKGQKTGIVVLLAILGIILIVNETLPYLVKEKEPDSTAFMAEVAQFKASLKDEPSKETDTTTLVTQKATARFNPNTLDSIGFISLGLKPFVAQNIIKYRLKGGKFNMPQDFSKIYGLSNEQFRQLLPYIYIPKAGVAKTIELNTCDTTQLIALKGIGSVLANRIIKYRTLLGGYSHKEQLKEVYGLPAETYDEIEAFITVDVTQVKKMTVNGTDNESLKRHPYTKPYATVIYNERNKLGKLTSVTDLQDIPELPATMLEKIAPYLSFE